MKRPQILSELIIFSLILIFLIIPPFFTPKITDSNLLFDWSFPLNQGCLLVFALILYFFSKNLNTKKGFFYPSMICLGLLLTSAFLMKFLSGSLGAANAKMIPDSGKKWIFCLLTFCFSSTYEEIIYRFYFTDALKRFFPNAKNEKRKNIITELAGVLVFAFAHLYLGWLSVINAAIAHVILRLLYKVTNSIWNCALIHFIYNVISLILL